MILSINIPDAIAKRVLDAFSAKHGGEDNTEPELFAKFRLIDYLKESVIEYEGNQAYTNAYKDALEDANTKVKISIEAPDELIEAFCQENQYDPNSEVTKKNFVKESLRSSLLSQFSNNEAIERAKVAKEQAILAATDDLLSLS